MDFNEFKLHQIIILFSHEFEPIGNDQILDILAKSGAKVDHRDKKGWAALHEASFYSSNEIRLIAEIGGWS